MALSPKLKEMLAIQDYDDAVRLEPGIPLPTTPGAVPIPKLGSTTAQFRIDRAISLYPEFGLAYYDRGMAAKGEYDRASKILIPQATSRLTLPPPTTTWESRILRKPSTRSRTKRSVSTLNLSSPTMGSLRTHRRCKTLTKRSVSPLTLPVTTTTGWAGFAIRVPTQ